MVKKEKEVKCYDCDADLDIRTKAKVLRDKDLEWICGDCNRKSILENKKPRVEVESTGEKPFYEKGVVGKVKRYLWDDTINDIKKFGKDKGEK